MDVIYGFTSAVLMPAVIGASVLFTFYLLAMGIGHVRDELKEKGGSFFKIETVSFLVWIPIGLTIFSITKWF